MVLASGEEIDAAVVVSSLDPHRTFLRLMDAEALPAEFLEDVRRYKLRGSSGKVNLALDGLPDFKCLPGPGAHLRGAISISPGVEYMERAYDDAKYGDFSKRPVHGHGDPVAHRSVGRAARQARHVLLRAVRALQAARRDLGREARGLRRHRRGHDRASTRPT